MGRKMPVILLPRLVVSPRHYFYREMRSSCPFHTSSILPICNESQTPCSESAIGNPINHCLERRPSRRTQHHKVHALHNTFSIAHVLVIVGFFGCLGFIGIFFVHPSPPISPTSSTSSMRTSTIPSLRQRFRRKRRRRAAVVQATRGCNESGCHSTCPKS